MFFRRNFAGAALPRDHAQQQRQRTILSFTFSLLLIEFFDELVFGVREAAWPLIRDDLGLSYTEVGMLLSVPVIFGNLVEPWLGILADVWKRRVLVLGGGIVFAVALALVSLSYGFAALLVAFVLFNPASGAFVSLSQATLMDSAPERREQNMARWTLSGSLGNVFGTLAIGGALVVGLGWRWLFAGMVVFTLLLLALVWRAPFPAAAPVEQEIKTSFRLGLRNALSALRRRDVVRWLILLEFGDLTWDVMRGFLALYFVDVVKTSEAEAAFAVLVWTLIGLPGDFLLLPLLERVRGLSYLRWSTTATLVLFPAFLLASDFRVKLILLGLLGFANAGWYAILKAQLYTSMPGQSGTAMMLGNVFGFVSSFVPLALGLFAQTYGLSNMMWLLIIGPAVLLLGITVRIAD
ncbi:MAG TPA: MFS transporter [Pyrinomonadaceae bacterium]|jgi:FSR family fosmidomycin resistance protein-like MFS transporter